MFCIIARHAHGLFDGSIARQPTSVGATGSFFQIVPSFYKHLTLIVSESNLILTHEQLSLLVFSYICVKLTDTSIVIDSRYTIYMKVTIMYIKRTATFFSRKWKPKVQAAWKIFESLPARNYREIKKKKEKDSDVWWSRGGVLSVKEFDKRTYDGVYYMCVRFSIYVGVTMPSSARTNLLFFLQRQIESTCARSRVEAELPYLLYSLL